MPVQVHQLLKQTLLVLPSQLRARVDASQARRAARALARRRSSSGIGLCSVGVHFRRTLLPGLPNLHRLPLRLSSSLWPS